MKRCAIVILLALAVLQAGAIPSIVRAQSPTPLEPASLLVAVSELGSGWSLVESSTSPGEAHAMYAAPEQVSLTASVSVFASADAAAWWMARVRTDFAMAGNDLSDVAGLGDVGYGRTRATGGSARAAYVFSVERLGAVVEASSGSSSADVQSLALQFAQRQATRFRAAVSSSTIPPAVPSAAPAAAPTPVPAPPPSAPAMVLAAQALGPEWVMIDRATDRGSERLQYFNNAVDQARFRIAKITLEMYWDQQQAASATAETRSALEGFRYDVAPTLDTGPGDGFRAVQVDEHGLVDVIRLFDVENVAVSVSLTGIYDQQRLEDVDADNLKLAAVQRARVEAVLARQPVVAAPAAVAWPSVPDPTSLVVPAERLGPGWMLDADNDRGTDGDLLRTHARMFLYRAEDAPQCGGLISVTLARDEPTARMALGMFLADWHTKGYTIVPAENLAEGLTFPTYAATHLWVPGLAEAGYLYQTGQAVVQVSVTSCGAVPDDLLPTASDWARWQALRVVDRPALEVSLGPQA